MPRLTPLFLATTSIAVIVSAYLWQELRTSREANEQLQDRVAQLEIAQQRERQNESLARAAAAAAAPVSAVTPASAAVPAPTAKAAGTAAKPASINFRDLLKDPDYREAQRAQIRLSLPQVFPDLAKVLGLTPEQVNALFDLLAKQQIDLMASSFGPNDSEEVRQQALRAATDLARTQQNEIENQLGAVKYQQWRDYQQTLGARQQISQLRSTLSTAGYPLTDDQAVPLLDALIAEQKRRSDEGRGRTVPTDPLARLDFQEQNLKAQEEGNQRVLDAAQSYLTSEQLSALKNSMTQQLGMKRAFLKAQRAQLEAGGGNPGPATAPVVTVPAAP